MKFGEKVKEQRKKRGLGQDELANMLGVTRRTLTNYETGVSYPREREVYSKLAEIFQTNINYFLTEDEEFLTTAAERYGRRGLSQAQSILEETAALFAGGELSEQDKLGFLHEMQAIFFDSTERAREKFTPKKYRKTENPSKK